MANDNNGKDVTKGEVRLNKAEINSIMNNAHSYFVKVQFTSVLLRDNKELNTLICKDAVRFYKLEWINEEDALLKVVNKVSVKTENYV